MPYRLGVDLGTTFTAAAVADDRTEPTVVGLGNRALQIPSVLFLKPDGEFLVGEAAERRGLTEPDRLAREFKRRIGDHVPIMVAGSPFSPQALTAHLLSWVVAAVAERMGERPAEVILTHPANWGPFRLELLDQVAVMAGVEPVQRCTEPAAAAIQYAAQTRVAPGDRVAVYDLGGGTFDACVLEKTEVGFRALGTPEGVEHLGGVDFDEAVLRHVLGALGAPATVLDPEDPAVTVGLARLRRDCVEAKEALSTDVDTLVPVALPGLNTTIRVTRAEFEAMIRPALTETIAAMGRALRSAQVEPSTLRSILLVGGSSRIPLVSELLTREFGVPTALDTHPKHDVALGSVRLGRSEAEVVTAPGPGPTTASTAGPATAEAAVSGGPGQPPPVPPPDLPRAVRPSASAPDGVTRQPSPSTTPAPTPPSTQTPPRAVPSQPVGPPSPDPAAANRPGRRRIPRSALVAAAAVVIVGLVAGGLALASRIGSRQQAVAQSPVPSVAVLPGTSAPSPGSSTPVASPSPAEPSTPSAPPVAELRVLAHEGGDEHFPPETTAALVDAVKRGYAAETDVRWTADGVPVLAHDQKTSSPMNCGRSYEIAKTTYATLQQKCRSTRNGRSHGLPTFAEAAKQVSAVPGGQLFVEIKTVQSPDQAATFYQTLVENDLLDRAVVTSFLPAELAKIRALDRAAGGRLRLMHFVQDEALSPTEAKQAGLWAVAIRFDTVRPAYVRGLHDRRITVIGWTANNASDWSRLRAAKVDYVLTDKPGAYLRWKG